VSALLSELVAGFSGGADVLLDFGVDRGADVVTARLAGFASARVRQLPAESLATRLVRLLRLRIAPPRLYGAVKASPAAAMGLLQGDTLWDADFFVAPAETGELDALAPLHDGQAPAVEPAWLFSQETGSFLWALAAKDAEELERVVAVAADVFKRRSVELEIDDEAPGALQVAFGSKVLGRRARRPRQ